MRRCNAITPFLRWQRGVLPSSDLEMPPCMVFNPVIAAAVKPLRSAGRGKCTVETLQERTNGTASVPCLAESIEVDEPEMYKELRRYTQEKLESFFF